MKKNKTAVLTSNQWDKVAEIYHRGIGRKGDVLHQKYIDPLIFEFLKGTTKADILDAGCGNGYLLHGLAKYAKSMVGLDYSKRLLDFAKDHTKPLKNVMLLHANLLKTLPLENKTFDVVIANMVLQYLPELTMCAKESSRVLKKEGTLIVVVDHPGRQLFARAQELKGHKSDKFLRTGSYFETSMRTKKSLWDTGLLEYFHRPIKEYLNPFTPYFHLSKMAENSEDGECPRILGLKFKKL